MTEQEAKTKMCPVAALRGNYDGSGIQSSLCIGSACMAWQWDSPPEYSTGSDYWDAYLRAGAKAETDKKINGFCGLAGKP